MVLWKAVLIIGCVLVGVGVWKTGSSSGYDDAEAGAFGR